MSSTEIKPHAVFAEDENGKPTMQIAWIEPAREAEAAAMLARPAVGQDNRSEWFWMRLHDGTLMLGTFPQGDTYMEFSDGGVCDWKWEQEVEKA